MHLREFAYRNQITLSAGQSNLLLKKFNLKARNGRGICTRTVKILPLAGTLG
jgi:hypothetical protein